MGEGELSQEGGSLVRLYYETNDAHGKFVFFRGAVGKNGTGEKGKRKRFGGKEKDAMSSP